MTFSDLPPDKKAIAQAAVAALRLAEGPTAGFMQLLGVRFEHVGDGQCHASLTIRAHLLNPLGIAHGGVAFALADTSSGLAALSLLPVPSLVTQDMQIRYHGPARPGQLTCRAEVVHKGQRTITTQARLTQDDRLIATATGTFAILSDAERAQLNT